MCGLVFCSGELHNARPAPDDLFKSACDLMTSRGPDASGIATFVDGVAGPIRMGHRRLAIVDISDAGNQPMWSDCGRFVIVYNGEVYNSESLRSDLIASGHRFSSRSDTEVIVNGYAEWGEAVVDRLNGMFAFVIWDTRDHCLFAARDRVGIKPLYIAESGQQIALASDLRVLERLGFTNDINIDALGAYLTLGYVPTPLSIFSGARKLEAGQTLRWKPGVGSEHRFYWHPPDAVASSQDADIDGLEDLVNLVTREHLLSDVPVGVFLSGGLDSSLIASSLATIGTDVKALTIGYSDAPDEDEAPIAERTAQYLGMAIERHNLNKDTATDFINSTFTALDEPLGYSAIVSQMAISHAARKAGLKVVLSGDGGDEVFGGYRWYESDMRSGLGKGNNFLGRLSTRFTGILGSSKLRRVANSSRETDFMQRSEFHRHLHAVFPTLRPDEVADIVPQLSAERAEELAIESLRRHDAPELPLKRRLQRIDLMTFCEGSVLPKVDRTSMAVGLEVRPPLLDHRVIEWGLSQPISDRMDAAPKNAVRHILRGRGLDFLLNEKKRGFSLKGISQLSGKNMLSDLWNTGEDRNLFKPASGLRLEPSSHSYKMKIQTLYFLDRWMRCRAKEKY
ncbi:asparagine synthase (glutamine-hydrolyzing) [uncultured Tateyamaria sp.]|uniref:asparagine synthase (glutamine-hydrolyzing) n=1 Tax=uncultured Tateyamaria sp. TaxID=455651 RepID=UPI00262A8D45|nr:asparagine synthase (glutamine-hydrolyzing) [uncultured Tateyamaria sp.]